MNEEIKKMLEKQLELLFKRSENCETCELSKLTDSMLEICRYLYDPVH